ncbi:haloacid dehalogenase type II [Herbaspirillum sp. NPDC087042]|uniref:haloacid dehalogenase type II n=1 Tax=Herbaspirillum sp. NPDC087042 TaxID=3364004 RepID=UPI00380046E4
MKPALSEVQVLGFDVFGTVVDWRNSIARQAEPFLARHGLAIDPVAFAVEWRSWYQPQLESVRSGQRPWVRLEVLHRESLERILQGHGLDPAALDDAELADFTRAWDRLDPWPDVRDGLRRLKRHYPLVTISNGHLAGMMQMGRHAGLPWDLVLGAEIAQAYKPQPQVYLQSAEAAGVAPAQLALVAAHNGDLRAARACGLKTIFVRRPTEHGPDQRIDLLPEEDWDIVVDGFTELADRLGCPHD